MASNGSPKRVYSTPHPLIHIPIQELGFDCVDFLPDFPSALRAVSMNTATHLRGKTWEIFLSNSQLLNRNVYTFYR